MQLIKKRLSDCLKKTGAVLKTLINKLLADKKVFIGAAVIILALIIILLVNLLSTSNRAMRALVSGDKLFAEAKYEKAAEKYNKAVILNPNLVKAYKGIILATEEFDVNEAELEFINSDEAVSKIDSSIVSDNYSDIVEMYLLVPELFSGDYEMALKLLESGYKISGNSVDLLPAIADACSQLSESLLETDIEAAIEYDLRALKITGMETGHEAEIVKILTENIYSYVTADDYDSAYGILSKYKDLYSIDAVAVEEYINSAKSMYDTKVRLLSRLYDNMYGYYEMYGNLDYERFSPCDNLIEGMPQYNFSETLACDGSEDAEILATSLSQGAYIYAPYYSSGYSGLAAGLFPYGEPFELEDGTTGVNYYFWFGNMVNGLRDGYGFSIAKVSDTVYVGFEGEWDNDVPNGLGAYYQIAGVGEDGLGQFGRVTYGEYVNGLQNGIMAVKIISGEARDVLFMGQYEASEGKGKAVPDKTDDYEILDEIPEDQTLIAVVPSVEDSYNIYIKILQKNTETLSALGY